VPAADRAPAINPAPAAGTVPEIPGDGNGASPGEAGTATSPKVASSTVVPDVSDALSAMLAAAIPGANFADPANFTDPLGSIGSAGSEADISHGTHDVDLPPANGAESGG